MGLAQVNVSLTRASAGPKRGNTNQIQFQNMKIRKLENKQLVNEVA